MARESRDSERTRFRTAFGTALDAQLGRQRLSQSALAMRVGTSRAYVSAVMNGVRAPSPQWADTVADALALPDIVRGELHLAVAASNGYRVDLMKLALAGGKKRQKRPPP